VKRRSFLKTVPAAGLAMQGVFSQDTSEIRCQIIATWNNEQAVQESLRNLTNGASALQAVEEGAKIAESNPDDLSVGYGGLPDGDGKVTLDASIMDHEFNCGSVCYLQGYAHPVSVARDVMMKTDHVLLAGRGAQAFAKMHGHKKRKLLTGEAKQAFKEWKKNHKQGMNHDTIGILALDHLGHLAGACSTSGRAFKKPGRVGDSPIIGAGLYVDGQVGAASATGMGELMQKTLASFLVVQHMRSGDSPQAACKKTIDRIIEIFSDSEDQVALVALGINGICGFYSRYPGFTVALGNADGVRLIDSNFAQSKMEKH